MGGAPLEQQRTLLFIMTAANQDLAITAGGFAPLSRHAMMTVRHGRTETPNSISNTNQHGPSHTACDFHPENAMKKTPAP